MTNFEKYREEILKISERDNSFAVHKKTRVPVECTYMSCIDCLFDGSYCQPARTRWLYEEAVEPVPTLTVKERAFCEILGTDYYIVRDDAARLLITSLEPFTDGEKWMIMGPLFESFIKIDQNFFPFITWEPAKAWSIEDLLKLEVEE